MGLSRNKVAVPEGAAGTPPFWKLTPWVSVPERFRQWWTLTHRYDSPSSDSGPVLLARCYEIIEKDEAGPTGAVLGTRGVRTVRFSAPRIFSASPIAQLVRAPH